MSGQRQQHGTHDARPACGHFLGLDLGTSGLRGLLIDARQTVIAQAKASYPTARPHPGWSEQEPSDWIAAAREIIVTLQREAPEAMASLAGIGTSGHMHGAVLLGPDLNPLRPCIMWNDTRSADQAARLDAIPAMRRISGNIIFPGFTAPKLCWVAEKEPALFARIRAVVLPKDVLTLWLTGRLVTDISDASGTSWLDLAGRRWSEDLIAATGMRRAQLPPLQEGCAPAGTLRPDLAAELGLPQGVTVAAGAADNAAAACGIGALSNGQGFVSLGTSGVVLAARDGCDAAPETAVHSFAHAVPGRWYQMGVTLAATDSLNWLSRITGQPAAALTAALGAQPREPGSVWFLPYLSGERTPHNDGAIRGAFLGLGAEMGVPDMTRAVLEGVAFSLRDCLLAMQAAGARLDRAWAVGGGTASRYWLKLLAAMLDLPLDLPAGGEFGAAMGAARLGICAATGADPAQVMTPPASAETLDPDPKLAAACATAHRIWTTLYPGVKALTT